jgi:uncharacterized membrane protein
MTNTVEAEVDVDIPIERVYDQWMHLEHFPGIMHAVESIDTIDDLRSHWVVSIGGVERDFDAVIVERRPEHYVAWTAADESHSGRVEFAPLEDDGTRVSVSIAWEPEGFVENAGAALQLDDIQVGAELSRFKSFVEQTEMEKSRHRV